MNNNIISDSKFKTNYLKIRYVLAGDELTYNKALLLSEYLVYANNNTKTDQRTIQLLDSLFDTSFSINVALKGDKICFDFNINFVISQYISAEKYLTNVLRTYHDFIFNPVVENGSFSSKIVDKNKFNLINNIKAQYYDKGSYAYLQFNKAIGAKTPLALNTSGNEVIINNLKAADIMILHEQMISTQPYFKAYVNEKDNKQIKAFFDNNFLTSEQTPYLQIVALPDLKEKEMFEYDDISQGKLYLKIKFAKAFLKTDFVKYQLINTMLGGSAQSYLFKTVREEHNLCYSIKSMYNHYYNYLMIAAGIEVSNYEQTITLIKKIVDKIKNFAIDIDYFEAAKINLLDTMKKIKDEQESLVNYLINREALGLGSSLEEEIKAIEQLTLNDLEAVVAAMTVEFSYMLGAISHEK